MSVLVLNRDLVNPEKRILTLGSHWYGGVSVPELNNMQEILDWTSVQLVICHVLTDIREYLSTWASFDGFGVRPILPWDEYSNRLGALSIPADAPYQILQLNETISSDPDWVDFSRKIKKVPILVQTLIGEDCASVADRVYDIASDNWINHAKITISDTSKYVWKFSFNVPLIDWAKSVKTHTDIRSL